MSIHTYMIHPKEPAERYLPCMYICTVCMYICACTLFPSELYSDNYFFFHVLLQGDLYLDWIESTLIPLTVKTFPRFSVEHDHLGILGSSLVSATFEIGVYI